MESVSLRVADIFYSPFVPLEKVCLLSFQERHLLEIISSFDLQHINSETSVNEIDERLGSSKSF
jgi:hypothetical protein